MTLFGSSNAIHDLKIIPVFVLLKNPGLETLFIAAVSGMIST